MAQFRRQTGASGYLTSALIFAGFTALWAVIVRNDPYYRLTDVLGARVPLTILVYLVAMPFAGFLIGRWRYDGAHHGGAPGLAGKIVARSVHFIYAHSLLVIFTAAMAMDYFLGMNIDEQIRRLDDRMFDLAARFAPWLAAYLAGFNLGRAMRREAQDAGPAHAPEDAAHFGDAIKAPAPKKKRRGKRQAELAIEAIPLLPADPAELGDLQSPEPTEARGRTMSGLGAVPEAPANDHSGFLPPQDVDRLRPSLRELR